MLTTLDFGQQIDMLTQSELREALAEDARLRAAVTGVKTAELFVNVGTIGANVTNYITAANMGPASGYVWAVMNMGFEMSATSGVRIYKGPSVAPPVGNGRFIGATSGSIVQSASFSKGQCMWRSGDQFSFQVSTGAVFLLSVFIVAIECPAERIGELLL